MKCGCTAITGGTIITSKGEIYDRTLLIKHGKIDALLADSEAVPEGCVRIDAGGLRVIPGLIDAHVCGAVGVDCRQGLDAVEKMSACLAQHGITSWLPTLYSVPTDEQVTSISTIKDAIGASGGGAKALGIHLEGPYFAGAWRGIAREDDLCCPDAEANRDLLDECGDYISMVTLSPEVEGIIPLIEQFAGAGIVVAAGHTAADKETIVRARDAGLSHVTHIFNAMGDRDWMEPGVVKPGSSDFYLLEDNFTASVIGDGVHVTDKMVELLLRVKGVDKTIVITDLWPGAGWSGKEITYVTGEKTIVTKDCMRLKGSNLLAGGITFLNKCACNLMQVGQLSWPEAVRVACSNPAKLAGVSQSKGDIGVGMDADVLVADDSWVPQVVIAEGKILKNTLSKS